MRLVLPKLYVILDEALLNTPASECARQFLAAGVKLFQYRNKSASSAHLLNTSRDLVSILAAKQASLIVNDRPDVAVLAGSAGVHVGQDDLDVEQARAIVGAERWVGVSTHNIEQFRRSAASS